jgi:hypothetical protein
MTEFELEPIKRLTRDLRTAAKTLSTAEARFLVDAFYMMQRDRIRAAHQVRQLRESGEPHEVLTWLGENTTVLENSVKSALGVYAASQPVGKWALSICGIGPVISAGLLAHIEMEPWRCAVTKTDPNAKACRPAEPHGPQCHRIRLATAGQIWRFAGLDPTVKWEPKTKRPWNAALKRLCFLIGESFIKVKANENDFYGKLYVQRRAIEDERDAAGLFAEQAKQALKTKDWRRDTQTKTYYESGHLPPARLKLRAARWACKVFLSHYHAVAYRYHFGTNAPKPYVIEHLGHAHEIQVPNWPF